MAEPKHDPDNYRKLSEPFESTEAAEAAWSGFWEEFYALRNKWRLPDVYVICQVPIADAYAFLCGHCGSELNAEAMTAYALGREQSARQERIANVMAQAMKHKQGK